jgi:hypothetical protein
MNAYLDEQQQKRAIKKGTSVWGEGWGVAAASFATMVLVLVLG